MRVLSLGAGVQSTTLLLMACAGEEQIDCAIFADTRWEPSAVYAHLDWLEEQARKAGIAIHRVSAGNIREDALNRHSSAWLPLYVRNEQGARGLLKRQCTANYKLRPIKRQLRALGASRNKPADVVIGISLDEWRRMREADVQYIRHVYPLVDRRLTRGDCLAWLTRHSYRIPQKSSCIGCPFRRNADWRRLTPVEFEDAVAFDEAMRKQWNGRVRGYLHDTLVPLAVADLSTEQDRGQQEMDFDGCGVLCDGEEA